MSPKAIPLLLFVTASLFGIIRSSNFNLYKNFYIEDDCRIGNENIVYNLTDTNALSSAAVIRSTRNFQYQGNKNCKIQIRVPRNSGVTLSVRKIDLSRLGILCRDYLQVFYGWSSSTKLCNYVHDVDEFTSYSVYSSMNLTYYTAPDTGYHPTGVEVVVTAYNTFDCFGEKRFKCDNGHCIWKNLTCDGHNNCGDTSDENAFTCRFDLLPVHKALIALGVIIFVLVVVFMFVRFLRRRTIVTGSIIHIPPNPYTAPVPPYQATHPQGGFISQNPAGQMATYPPPKPPDAGFSNPCYPSGVPPGAYGQPMPPPYKG